MDETNNIVPLLPFSGIQFWAHSFCRSTLGFYEAFAEELDIPFRICIAHDNPTAREAIGFKAVEFAHLDLLLTTDKTAALVALNERAGWMQLFGTYQNAKHMKATIDEAIKKNCYVCIASEAPCNMEPPSPKRIAKQIYQNYLLRSRVASVTSGAKFILNWSGDCAKDLVSIGWNSGKIIPLGYFPPPLVGTKFSPRSAANHRPFKILCSSAHTWHRGPDILIEALAHLTQWNVPYEASFTGTGKLENAMRNRVKELGIDVNFLGLVPMEKLIELYQNCSVFVAPGRSEPWGIRVNDALNAGAPCVVSRGIGAAKLIDEYGFGLTFGNGDAVDLAWKLRYLASDSNLYHRVCENLNSSHDVLKPASAATRAVNYIKPMLNQRTSN